MGGNERRSRRRKGGRKKGNDGYSGGLNDGFVIKLKVAVIEVLVILRLIEDGSSDRS